ncbi:probable C-mannosyltransferase DPY19L1 isoform X1 [Osmia bicornis bicornis]|uniref:probable C-mannosyltransferase DPY19L1 isoform X1 n=2 Tax=Osmia bicornis bicornis TaxID=1437191 RepID=UPI001EAEA3D8|nr:probable C-mannosyltransferase DPY19L1 isoform X1 [Osmia bicornis bicornis]
MMAAESDRNAKGVKKQRYKSMYLYQLAVSLIGVAVGVFHRGHVSTLFENDRHFSHLSEIEREMSFRTEMGMYYYYYKTIAESKTFMDGLRKITHDNISEYGNVIDATKKYSLLPEVLAGYLYHCAKSMGIISIEQCWQVERGEGLRPVTSCEGLGVPIYFYLEVVWYCTMFTVVILFYYAIVLGNSIKSGIIATLFFFYNHNECTRVQWTPPLRESFAYPILLFQMYSTTVILRQSTTPGSDTDALMRMGVSTIISLCCWQFSQFVFTTQIIALLILKWMKIISNDLYICICVIQGSSAALAMNVVDRNPLLYSLYFCLLFTSCFLSFAIKFSKFMNTKVQTILEIVLTIVCTTVLKSDFSIICEDDAHVFNLLKSKLTDYKDFHTMLYTCSAEFDFLQYRSYETIVKTLLLPCAVLAGMLALYFWYRNYQIKGYPKCIDADLAYNGLQTGAFIIMAIFIMRLKLFMNPHLCIIAGTVCSNRYLEKFGLKNEMMKTAVTVLLISAMSYHGLEKLQEERSIIGEYSNIEQEELFEWIKSNTPEHAVFAGKMSLMANLMLSTGRPIVNNPYYESKEMRDRTMKVYEIFSRKDAASVYFNLRNMHVGYVVLEKSLCFGSANLQIGCQMIDLWDMVDNGTAKSAGKLPLCPLLFRGNAYPFKRAFVNNRYVVLQLDYSYYVEVKPKTSIPLHYQS